MDNVFCSALHTASHSPKSCTHCKNLNHKPENCSEYSSACSKRQGKKNLGKCFASLGLRELPVLSVDVSTISQSVSKNTSSLITKAVWKIVTLALKL